MPRFDPNFAAAYLADNISGDNRNMTEFEEADLSGFGQSSERNMANFEAAAEEWEAVTEVEATFGTGRKDNLAVVAAPLVTMEKILHHLQEPWIEDFVAQVSWLVKRIQHLNGPKTNYFIKVVKTCLLLSGSTVPLCCGSRLPHNYGTTYSSEHIF